MYDDLMLMLDGSYTFTKDGLPYNCPNADEWEEEYAVVNAWAKENPELVQHEQPKPSPTLDELKTIKKTKISAARYVYEISGIIFQGVHITTDREDQSMITAVALSATLNSDFKTVWKGSDGYINLTAQDALTLAYLVAEHVETAFAEEKRLSELIDNAETEEELAAITWTLV